MESGESGELPMEFVGFARFVRPPDKLNSIANSENLPLRRSSKITLGRKGGSRDRGFGGRGASRASLSESVDWEPTKRKQSFKSIVGQNH